MDLIEKLEQFGISKREAEVYIALLQKKEFTAPELTKITTITRTKIYDHLEKLIHKGLCYENLKNGQKYYTAVNPKIVLQDIIRNYELEIEQKKQNAELLQHELVSIHSGNVDNQSPVNYIEVLTEVSQIRSRWLDIQSNAKQEILAFTKPPYTRKIQNNLEQEAALLKNNLIIKSIYEYGNTPDEEFNELISGVEEFQKIGEEARVINELPMKLLICDETITMMALNDRVSLKPSITTIIIDHPSYAKAQKEVFNVYWEKAITVDEFRKKREADLKF